MIRTHDDIARECAVGPVAHTSALGAEDEIARKTVSTTAAANSGCAEAGNDVSEASATTGEFPHLNDATGKFVAENDRRIVAKRVVKHVKVGAADSAIRDLELDLVVTAAWFFNIANVDVPITRGIFYKRFHCR